MKSDNLAWFAAKMSCEKWNRSDWEPKWKISKIYKKWIVDKYYEGERKYYRRKLWDMARIEWEMRSQGSWVTYFKDRHHSDTYPWPYAHPRFADWKEEKGALVYDPSGSVVKHSTSYCAWKIFELTGKWPNANKEFHLEAKNWQYFLEQAGYTGLTVGPEPGHHYVVINPHDGEEGMVFWLEGQRAGCMDLIVSTYRDKHYSVEAIKPDKIGYYIWVRID